MNSWYDRQQEILRKMAELAALEHAKEVIRECNRRQINGNGDGDFIHNDDYNELFSKYDRVSAFAHARAAEELKRQQAQSREARKPLTQEQIKSMVKVMGLDWDACDVLGIHSNLGYIIVIPHSVKKQIQSRHINLEPIEEAIWTI